MRFSANLGFLYTDRTLPDAIRAAKSDDFDAVECHFPYETPPEEMRDVLKETGVRMLALNTWPGDRATGDFGLAAIPGRQEEARVEIARAIDYAATVGMDAVHVMAGRTDGGIAAEDQFRENLSYACNLAAARSLSILIEPINIRDVPQYHLCGTEHAEDIFQALGRPELKIMFDCYHMQIMEGDLASSLERLQPKIGHIQIAAVPDRGEPDQGEVNYSWLTRHLKQLGYNGHIGAEYKPRGTTTEGLGWLDTLRG